MADTYMEQLQQLASDTPPIGDLIVAVLTLRAVRDLVSSQVAASNPHQALVLIGKSVEECLGQIDPQKGP